jgi:hypothetical protein
MYLSNLPTEILEDVIHQAIVTRGIKRGLRLRLVNSKYLSGLKANKGIDYRQVISRAWFTKSFSPSNCSTMHMKWQVK